MTSRAGRDQLLALVLPDPDLVGHLREPVAAGATFVVNAEDEIRQAIKDYESGKFGEIPRTARL